MCRKWGRLSAIVLTAMVWLEASSVAKADFSQAKQVARLHQQIETERSQVRVLRERLLKDNSAMYPAPWRRRPYPPNPAAPAIQITDLETWWDSYGGGLAPTFRFHLHNIGSKPINNLDLRCTYSLASGSKFGSSGDGLVPNVVQIIAPGQWITVLFGADRYAGESVVKPLTVQAEIDLNTDENRHHLIRITIPPKPQRLPSDAALR